MPPRSTATRSLADPAAISFRAARALVASSAHAQYKIATASGGPALAGTSPSVAAIWARGSEIAPGRWALSYRRRSRVSTRTARPLAASARASVTETRRISSGSTVAVEEPGSALMDTHRNGSRVPRVHRPPNPRRQRPCIPARHAYFSEEMNNHALVPIGVFGASGYVGQELLRLLAHHPGAAVVFATAESAAGEVIEGHRLRRADDAPLHAAEIVLSALPHGVSGRYVHDARAAGELVANPGCYPTAALLALIPLAQQGLIDASREVVIDAASGVTGAGRTPKRELLFGEVTEDFRAYAVGNEHRHLPELRATLEREGGFTGDLVFTPHLLPVKRGILETIHVPLTRVLDQATAEDLYQAAYDGEPCVVLTRGTLPSLKDVVYRNRVAIGVVPVANVRRPRLTLAT